MKNPKSPDIKVVAKLPPPEAEDVGRGVSVITDLTPEKKPEKADAPVSLDGKMVWVDFPTIENQIAQPGMSRGKGKFVKVFDLSKTSDLTQYNQLLSKHDDPKTNIFIIKDEQQFDAKAGTWKVLVMCQVVEFKKIIKDSKHE